MMYNWWLYLILLFSILALQLGFNFWVSGSTLGTLSLVLLILIPCAGVQSFYKRLQPVELMIASALPIRMLLESATLRDFRILAFLFLYFLSFTLLASFKARRTSSLIAPVALASASAIFTLAFLYLANIFTSSYTYLSLIFLDKWLIANKTFEDVGQGLHASQYKYFDLVHRFSALYGEPSYFAGALFACMFIVIYSLIFFAGNSRQPYPTHRPAQKYLLELSIIIGFTLMVASASIYGLICSFFLLLQIYLSRKRLPGLRIYLYLFSLLLTLSIILNFLPNIDNPIFNLAQIRISGILNGDDGSQSTRLYAVQFFFDHPLGLGASGTQRLMIDAYGVDYIDNGVIANLLIHGIFFILFVGAIFSLILRRGAFFFPYCIYLLLIWMQSGNIFSPDKFFLSLLPLCVIHACSQSFSMVGRRPS